MQVGGCKEGEGSGLKKPGAKAKRMPTLYAMGKRKEHKQCEKGLRSSPRVGY